MYQEQIIDCHALVAKTFCILSLFFFFFFSWELYFYSIVTTNNLKTLLQRSFKWKLMDKVSTLKDLFDWQCRACPNLEIFVTVTDMKFALYCLYVDKFLFLFFVHSKKKISTEGIRFQIPSTIFTTKSCFHSIKSSPTKR